MITKYWQIYQHQKYLIIPINTMNNTYKRIRLPSDYAQLLLDRQIAVALSIEPLQDNVCALLELYSKGFEYYQSVGSYKYKFFDLKMKEIFTRKQNDENQINNSEGISVRPKQEIKRVGLQARKSVLQKNKYLNQVQNETNISTNTQSLQKILLMGEYKLIEVNMKMKHEIDYQHRLLKQKLQARHQKAIKNTHQGNKLTQNSTKTSLLSQSQHRKNVVVSLKDHIFEEQLLQNDQQYPNGRSSLFF